ncbi:MAG: HlyD family efflux transporter periplasmic adaptor subunit [Bacteroidota bacterium]
MPTNTRSIPIRSEAVQEILTAIPNWMIRWGNTLIFLLILLVLAISWFVRYPDVIAAEAVITTPQPPQKELANASGKIDTLLVNDHQMVQAGRPLAIIENAADFTDVFLLKSIVDAIQLNKEQFSFPSEALPLLFLGEIEMDFALFENSYDQYMLNKKWQPFSNEVEAHRASLAHLQRRLQNQEAQQSISTQELAYQKKELERQKRLYAEGLIAEQTYEARQLEYLQAERRNKDRSLAISQTKEAISTAQVSSKRTVIDQKKTEKVLLRKVIQSFNQLKKAIKDWEMKYVLKASIAGKVSFLDFWSAKQTVQTGDLVFTILPVQSRQYIAKLKMPALNSGKIKIGQQVNLKLDNYPETEFGVLSGQIQHVSLLTDQEGFYLLDAVLPEKLVTSYQKEIEFRQEMRGRAEIITEDLRLVERFFYQLIQAFKR